jgi:phenylalanyl-tRNA synthetase beta subunit
VRDCGLENLESLSCLDRYEGPGVAEAAVKTAIRLRLRSPERTLEQEEVNRQVERLAEELRSRLGVQFS